MKSGKTVEQAASGDGYFTPIDRVAEGTFLSIEKSTDTDEYTFMFHTSSGRKEPLNNFSSKKSLTAFSAASPDKFVYCIGDEYFRSIYLSGRSAKEVKEKISSFTKIDLIAASGDLTAISSKGASVVKFWEHDSILLKAIYNRENVCGLSRSKCWFFVKRQHSVVFYSIPYLDLTRMIPLDDFTSLSSAEQWTVNIAPDETFVVIHSGKKMLLFHILSTVLIGEQRLPEKPQDICLLPAGEVFVVFKKVICIVHPSKLRLVKRVRNLGKENVWGFADKWQRALV